MLQAESFSPAPLLAQCIPPHVSGTHPEVLHRILSPGINLSLWQRQAKPEISREVSALKASDLADARCETSLPTFDEDVSRLLRDAGLNPDAFQHWRKDLHRLAEIYFRTSQDRPVTLRLETSDETICPRFHIDHTHLRLLCTYRGEGTEWLNEWQTDREAQRTGAPNMDIISFGEPANFDLFSVGIMKGSAYPKNAERGLVHRSPEVKGDDRVRVLFCLDS